MGGFLAFGLCQTVLNRTRDPRGVPKIGGRASCYGVYDRTAVAHQQMQADSIPFDGSLNIPSSTGDMVSIPYPVDSPLLHERTIRAVLDGERGND